LGAYLAILDELDFAILVPLGGLELNTLFDELAALHDQVRPYKYELDELGL
jgi:hypothetical protein